MVFFGTTFLFSSTARGAQPLADPITGCFGPLPATRRENRNTLLPKLSIALANGVENLGKAAFQIGKFEWVRLNLPAVGASQSCIGVLECLFRKGWRTRKMGGGGVVDTRRVVDGRGGGVVAPPSLFFALAILQVIAACKHSAARRTTENQKRKLTEWDGQSSVRRKVSLRRAPRPRLSSGHRS